MDAPENVSAGATVALAPRARKPRKSGRWLLATGLVVLLLAGVPFAILLSLQGRPKPSVKATLPPTQPEVRSNVALKGISIAPNGGWLIFYDYAHVERDIPAETSQKLNELALLHGATPGAQPKFLAWAPATAW